MRSNAIARFGLTLRLLQRSRPASFWSSALRGSRGFGFSRGVSCGYFCGRRVFGIHGRNFGDAVEQGIDSRAHFGFVGPLLVKSFFQNVDGFEAEIDDLRKRIDFAFAESGRSDLQHGGRYRRDA